MWAVQCGGSLLTVRSVGRIRNWSVTLGCRVFSLGTLNGIIGTCQSDFPWIRPGPRVPWQSTLFHFHTFYWRKILRHWFPTVSDGGDKQRLATSATADQRWKKKRKESSKKSRKKGFANTILFIQIVFGMEKWRKMIFKKGKQAWQFSVRRRRRRRSRQTEFVSCHWYSLITSQWEKETETSTSFWHVIHLLVPYQAFAVCMAYVTYLPWVKF